MIKQYKDIRCSLPLRIFYVFPNISALRVSSREFAKRLAIEARVATVPRTAFGPDGKRYLNSYASSTEIITETLRRIEAITEKIL